ncbi:hypothetical protein Y032_0501g2595 [Ancylostoma ceylanicum]|uniref:Uncharacterized protein n=1 Tax=Ancylostoma ceylanicum TaxID=53326 RepID=A0A016WV78_9BILA|nr:hypothetical protein Y032_0501g2595 [Ancylostoma ceylanicum]
MYHLSKTTGHSVKSRGDHACQHSTSSSLVCVLRFIVIFTISTNDLAVTWATWQLTAYVRAGPGSQTASAAPSFRIDGTAELATLTLSAVFFFLR